MDNIILIGKTYRKPQQECNKNNKMIDFNSSKRVNQSFKKIIDNNKGWNCTPNFSKPDIIYPKIIKTDFSPQYKKYKKKDKNSSIILRQYNVNSHNKYKSIENNNNTSQAEITKISSNAISYKSRISQLKFLPKLSKQNFKEPYYSSPSNPSQEFSSRVDEEKKKLDSPEKLINTILKLDNYNRNGCIENLNSKVNLSNDRKREMLLEIYKSEAGILYAIKERLKELKFKREYLMRKVSTKSFSLFKSPYSFPVWNRNRKFTDRKQVDELVASMEKKLNDELDLIWKNVENSPSKKTSTLKSSLQDSENFSSEYRDTVGKLRPEEPKFDKKESSSMYQASFLKSCATRTINLLNQASLKLNFGNSKSPSGKLDSPNFDKEFENTSLKTDEKIEDQAYEKLAEEMGSKIKWKQGDIIGAGKFGQVMKCLNSTTGTFFAAKRIQIGSFNLHENQNQLKELDHEINILQSLTHPNIVQYLGSEILGVEFYIYMEYVSGGSIKSLINKFGPLDEKTIKIYTKQILEGLAYLHTNKIIHMDIKSANILVSTEGKIKLSDFGCSSNLDFMKNKNQIIDTIKGSLPWMAPEVINDMAYSLKSDVWSLGCTLIEMASGRTPWGEFDNMMNAIFFISKSNKIPPIPDNLSDDAKFFISECLNRDVSERPNVMELFDFPFISKV